MRPKPDKPFAQPGSSTKWVRQVLRGYVYVMTAILACAGLVLVFTAGDSARLPHFRERDALFGLTARTLLAMGGLLHLVLSVYLVLGKDWMMRGLVLLWVGLNHIVYYLGMLWLHVAAPFPAALLVGWRIGVRPEVVDRRWKGLIAWLVVGGVCLLLAERRRTKRAAAAAFLNRWRELREQRDKPQ